MITTDFLLQVRRAIGVPNYQARFSQVDVLDIASSQLNTFVVPEIRSLRKDFFVVSKDYTLTTGENEIEIPERASGRSIKTLWFTDVKNFFYASPLF